MISNEYLWKTGVRTANIPKRLLDYLRNALIFHCEDDENKTIILTDKSTFWNEDVIEM